MDLSGTCETLRWEPGDVRVQGSVAAVECLPDDPFVEDVGLYLFSSLDDLNAWWLERLSMIEKPLEPGNCLDSQPGAGTYSSGRVACYAGKRGHVR